MKYGYYPGCCMHSTAPEYEASLMAVCGKLGIELQEVEGWICCGTSPAHSASRLLSLALPLENLRLAEEMELSELVAPCASCFARLKVARHEASSDPRLTEQLSEVLEAPVPQSIDILHPLEIFVNGVDIGAAVERELPDLKVVCYYGCLLTRPPDTMRFDECEYPMSMDLCLQAAGIQTLDWSRKTDCCGGALVLSETDVARKLTRDVLEEASSVGANAIAVACPLCHATLDMRQTEIEQKFDTSYGFPVFYFTQLLGLAFGIPARRLGIHKHFVAADELLSGAGA